MVSKKQIFISTIILLLVGTLMHFTYEFFNNNYIIGLVTPVNESVFEHLKLAIFPIFLWWLLFYYLKRRKYDLDKNKWFLSCCISMFLATIIIPSIFYMIKYGVGKEGMLINIFALYIGIFIGQFIGYYSYNHNFKCKFSNLITLFMIALFIVLTIVPPKIPLFEDPKNHTYGIHKKE